jgi:hypothetical protein
MKYVSQFAAYEIHNPSFNDMTLDQQIEVGINDWAVEGKSGHLYFGRTEQEALQIAKQYNFR